MVFYAVRGDKKIRCWLQDFIKINGFIGDDEKGSPNIRISDR